MRTIETKLYSFTELSDEAKKPAIQAYQESNTEHHWNAEWRDSFNALAEHFCGTVKDYQVSSCSYSHGSIDSRLDDAVLDLEGVRAWAWIHANGYALAADEYPTGYYGDHDAFSPLWAFLARPSMGVSIRELIQNCADSLIAGWVSDMEYQDSEECALEYLENDEAEHFTVDGARF